MLTVLVSLHTMMVRVRSLLIRASAWLRNRQDVRDDVVWCYRVLLGREPESEEAVRAHVRRGGLRPLVESFIASAEFAQRRSLRWFHPIPTPQARVDVGANAQQMQAAIAKVRGTWSHLGESRPHHSVLTNDMFLPDSLPIYIDHFWTTGDEEAKQVGALLAAHGASPEGKTCVEYGCGVGRVTTGLARQFVQVHGYDISPGHLAEAEARMRSQGLRNVELHLCADSLLQPLEPCDVFYSRIVFQHNPPPLMATLVRSALDALTPGGIAIFQLPVHATGYTFDLNAWLAAGPADDMEMHCLPQSVVFRIVAEAGCLPLEVREEDSTGDGSYISNLFVVQRPPFAHKSAVT